MADAAKHFLLALLLVVSGAPAWGYDVEEADSAIRLDEVEVTDVHVNRHNLTPVAATTVTAARLAAQETVSLKELSAVIPNFFMPDYAARTTAPIYIRGVGIKSDGTASAFYVDGIPYYEPITFETDLGDIAAVEVLRGPQGTLLGRNSMGGAVNIHTASPFCRQVTRLRLGYGNYHDLRTSVTTSQLLSARLGLAAGASYHHGGGFFRNAYDGRRADPIDETEEHIGLYYKPAQRWLLRLTSRLAYHGQGGYSYAPYDAEADTLGTIAYNRESGFRRLVSTSGLAVQYEGSRVSVISQTAFQYLKSHQYVDQDYTTTDKTYLLGNRHQHMLSEEVVVKSSGTGRYQWITGLFAMYQHVDRQTDNEKPTAQTATHADYHQPTSSVALYHQSSYNLWRGLSLSAGLRLDYEHTRSRYTRLSVNEKKGTSEQTADFDKTQHFTQLTPKAALQYLTTQGYKYYAMATRGYKPGGFNRSIATEAEQQYDPEYSWNYEVGFHLPLLAGRLTVDGALFYIDWRDTQLTYTYTGIGTLTTNAGHADSKGVELTVAAQPVSGLRLDLSYGYTYARFLSYRKTDEVDYTGHRLPMVPSHTLSLNANYTRHHVGWLDRLTVNAGLTGLGSICWAEDNKVQQPFYAVLNAKVAATKGIATLELWAKNLTSTRYLANVMSVSTGTYAQRGKPFTVGASVVVEI